MKGSGRAGTLAGPTFTRGTVPEFTTQDKTGKLVWEPGLPAEVTARRVHRPARGKEPIEEAPVQCDLRSTLKLTPSARADWLEKALKAIPHGRAKVQEVFNVVTHPKFVSGVPTRIGRRMLHEVAKSLGEFSDRQRLTLVAKCKLAKLFQATSSGDGEEEDDGDVVPEACDVVIGAADEENINRKERHHHRGGSRSHSRERRRRRRAPSESPPPPPGLDGHHSGRLPPSAAASSEVGVADHDDIHGFAGGSDEQLPSPEDAVSYEEAVMERERQQEEEKRKLEHERLMFEERERKRKANLGAAFLVGDEDDDDEAARPAPFGSGRVKPSDIAFADPTPAMSWVGAPGPVKGGGSMSADSSGMDPRFVVSMGGDKLLAEAHKILASASRTGRLGAPEPMRGRSRSHRRRSRSRSRRGGNMRSSGSYRSPTPDGPARGMARAARKAKMIASLMGMK